MVRVVLTADLQTPSSISYLAFSYCWGPPDPNIEWLKLTLDTNASFTKGVPRASLANNVRDACWATLQLGFRYIWIDSLCIRQGEGGDFDTEAPLMNLVYRNAALTLASAAASGATEPMFRDREPDFIRAYKMDVEESEKPATRPQKGMRPNTESVRSHPGFYQAIAGSPSHWDQGVTQAPLNRRGWVLQERVLSPRTVYFSTTQLFWECRELRASESFPSGVPKNLSGPTIKVPDETAAIIISGEQQRRKFKDWRELFQIPDGTIPDRPDKVIGGPRRGKYKHWREMLHSYMACELTRASDRLPAISGLEQEFQKVYEDELVWGLWRKNLINELLWRRDPAASDVTYGNRPHVGPGHPTAPSWTWVSIDSEVVFLEEDELESQDYAEVKNVGHDSIHLRCYLVEIQRPTTRTPGLNWIEFDSVVDNKYTWTQDTHYFLPLREWRWANDQQLQDKYLTGLVLRAAQDQHRTARSYERVGILNVDKGFPIAFLHHPPKTQPGEKVRKLIYEPKPSLQEVWEEKVGGQVIKAAEFEWVSKDIERTEIFLI